MSPSPIFYQDFWLLVLIAVRNRTKHLKRQRINTVAELDSTSLVVGLVIFVFSFFKSPQNSSCFLVSKPSLVGLALVFGREHDGIPTEAEELLDEAGVNSSCRQSPAADKRHPKKDEEVRHATLPKFNMEPENGTLEQEIPFGNYHS